MVLASAEEAFTTLWPGMNRMAALTFACHNAILMPMPEGRILPVLTEQTIHQGGGYNERAK